MGQSYEPARPASTGRAKLSPLGQLVRRHDPDRFLTALFAPAERRETLFALYALNHELARAWEVASQPTLALIRLQWWREVVEGADRRHEVATPLMAEIAAGRLDRADALALIEGRERVADGLATLADWQAYLEATAGRLAEAAGRVLGGADPRLGGLGAGYGAAGHLRGVVSWAGSRLSPPAELAEWAGWRLGRPAPMARGVLPAGLVGVLGRRDLRRPGPAAPRGLGDRAAVMLAAALGRV